MNAFVDVVVAIVKTINAVLSVIPALVWAIALMVTFSWGGIMHHERDTAVSERNVVQASYEQLTVKVIRQKNEAAALLKQLTAERDALQARINDAHRAQEKKDANNQVTISGLTRELAAVQLRDPGRRGSSGGGTQGDAATGARGSPADPAQGAGLLSEEASRFLRSLVLEADVVNAAYESCRADAVNVRQTSSPAR